MWVGEAERTISIFVRLAGLWLQVKVKHIAALTKDHRKAAVSTTYSAMKPPTSSPRRNTMPLSHIQATLMLISLS